MIKSLFKTDDFWVRFKYYTNDISHAELNQKISENVKDLEIYKIGKETKNPIAMQAIIHYNVQKDVFTLPCNIILYSLMTLDDWAKKGIELTTREWIINEIRYTNDFIKNEKLTFNSIYDDYFKSFLKLLNSGVVENKIIRKMHNQFTNDLRPVFKDKKDEEKELVILFENMLLKDLYMVKPDFYKKYETEFLKYRLKRRG
jgi:hypothetical protein